MSARRLPLFSSRTVFIIFLLYYFALTQEALTAVPIIMAIIYTRCVLLSMRNWWKNLPQAIKPVLPSVWNACKTAGILKPTRGKRSGTSNRIFSSIRVLSSRRWTMESKIDISKAKISHLISISAYSFNTQFGRLSGPLALVILICLSFCVTICAAFFYFFFTDRATAV